MKSILKLLSLVILFSSLVLDSFAIDSPSNFISNDNSATSVSLSWDTVDDAVMYYVLYSTESWIGSSYDNNTDLLEDNFIEINDLSAGWTYYFSVVSFDENWDESVGSNELVINLSEGVVINNFILETVNVISADVIELDFSENLEKWDNPTREFKITNSLDEFDSFEVVSNELNIDDESKITLVLDRNLIEWNEYEVVIIAITSVLGNNIESWIDNAIKFIANIPVYNSNDDSWTTVINDDQSVTVNNPDWSTTTTNPDWTIIIVYADGTTTNIDSDGTIVEDEVEFNSAAEEQTGVEWIDIAAEDIENTALFIAENNSNLPKTWPEHVLMLILSIILWVLIFIFKYKKA